ncbi:MAG: neuraminidase-like domain-containing protein, partial [Candidatus Binataceae bacterium]
ARALSDLVLTDVEVDPSLETSPITEAIAALQLYFYRCLTHLEPAAAFKNNGTSSRAEFREEWSWLKNYRVWEANRKVFLYPESYIRPELRTSRTGAFKTLLDNLSQGEITDVSVTDAYKKYLDEYTEVSRLTIAGGYVQPDPKNALGAELTLFGATRTDPQRYYYRTATFSDDSTSTGTWLEWRSLGIDINADRVYPVRAFGRTFVFWAEVENVQPDDTTSHNLTTKSAGDSSKGDGTTTVSGESHTEYRIKLMYSFHDLNDQWTTPQTLSFGPTENKQIQPPLLWVTCTTGSDGIESIVVNYQYGAVGSGKGQPATIVNGARLLTADLTSSETGIFLIADRRIDMLRALFAPNEILGPNDVVALGSTGHYAKALWYSVDLKGGSFLAKPILPEAEKETRLPLAGNQDRLPNWPSVNASLDATDGNGYLFNNARMAYWQRPREGQPSEHPIGDRWGLRHTTVHADGQIDAAWTRHGVLFLARGDRYLKYSHGTEWADDEGDRGVTEDERKADGVPNWPNIRAAFTDEKTNTTFFFRGRSFAALDAANKLGAETDIRERWGRQLNDFNGPAAGLPTVVAAFTRDGRSFLIGPKTYTWYSDPGFMICETPKPQTLQAVLAELKCVNLAAAEGIATIEEVVDSGAELLFKVRRGEEHEGYSLQDNKITKVNPIPKGGPWAYVAAFTQEGKQFALTRGEHGLSLTVSGSAEHRDNLPPDRVHTMVLGLDGNLYLFGADRYAELAPREINVAAIGNAIEQWTARSLPIASRWGQASVYARDGAEITAALVRGEHLFLLSGDSYVRYSDAEYRFVDPGYPRPLAANPDGLPQEPFQAPFEDTGRKLMCFVLGSEHVYDNALTARIPNQSRWGRLRTNILQHGVDAAYRVDRRHYLFSRNEIACYTANSGGALPAYMDGAPVPIEFGSFAAVRGAFAYQGYLYLVGPGSFVCCPASEPEQPLPGYPRTGQASELVDDLRRRFAPQAADGLDIDVKGRKVYALILRDSALFLDIGDQTPGQLVLRLDLPTGQLSRELGGLLFGSTGVFWPPLPSQGTSIDWKTIRRDNTAVVDLPEGNYRFHNSEVTITRPNSPAETKSIAAVWGAGRPFDTAFSYGDRVYLFTGDRYSTLPMAFATDERGGKELAANLEMALAASTPISNGLVGFPLDPALALDAVLGSSPFYFFSGHDYWRLANFPTEVGSLQYELVRLTTSTAAALNREFFAGGVPQLLSLRTQETNETPAFSYSTGSSAVIQVNKGRVREETLPMQGHLDFASANGLYLWEIFFHAPFLIAGMLSTAQRFEEAKTWYEYVFDPSEPADTWKFLPFLELDVERIVFEIDDRLDRLEDAKADVASSRAAFAPFRPRLLAIDAAFKGERNLTPDEHKLLGELKLAKLPLLHNTAQQALCDDLQELFGMLGELKSRWEEMQTARLQLEVYLDDPFDPDAIAALRPIAYRKAFVMRYLDNLLDWADMLFGQYTRESITEAQMLYVEASYLLGRQPESNGRLLLSTDQAFGQLQHGADEFAPPASAAANGATGGAPGIDAALIFAASLLPAKNSSLSLPYFFIPPNDEIEQYWTKVADRLYKIRHGLNLLGEKQPLALFEPPIDPMALVQAIAGGASLADAIAGAAAIDVPHYRFTFLAAQAQDLAQKAAQLGSELLSALEKHDAEMLNRLQAVQEGVILSLTR